MHKKPVITYKNRSGVLVTLRGNDAIVWILENLEKRLAALESAHQQDTQDA